MSSGSSISEIGIELLELEPDRLAAAEGRLDVVADELRVLPGVATAAGGGGSDEACDGSASATAAAADDCAGAGSPGAPAGLVLRMIRWCAGWWTTGAEIVRWSSIAPPAVTIAAASRVTTWPAPAPIAPTDATAPVPATPLVTAALPLATAPLPAALPAALPPAPPIPSSFAITPIGPSPGTSAASWRLTPRTSERNSRQPAQSCM
jgi:cell division septation protein DedD